MLLGLIECALTRRSSGTSGPAGAGPSAAQLGVRTQSLFGFVVSASLSPSRLEAKAVSLKARCPGLAESPRREAASTSAAESGWLRSWLEPSLIGSNFGGF